MWRDARQRPPLPHRFPGTADVQILQVPQAAVNRPKVVERAAASEVAALDERHRQAALRRVAGNCQPVDAAPDDKDVVGSRRKLIDVTNHIANITDHDCRRATPSGLV